ncbi:MAG: endolytic transglycosylase MltG [Corynebacterium sp.]|uniref:endolytic transglycosylase MltG n=1 Tax=Corynebacterium sp. TaxID=1720 RepID=UPI0026DD8F26|nr:endolytic transglycosylase MltG [Corynebacterium sp.]MDO5029138.1 endolytic transglycosylase MltG [Corynebacterium sp.]
MSKDAQTARRTESSGTNPTRARARSGGAKPRVRHRQTALAINVTSIVLCVLIVAVIGLVWKRGGIVDDYDGNAMGPVTVVEVADGTSLTDLSNKLVERDVVKSSQAFIEAANENTHSSELQPGFYRLQERMSADDAVAALLDVENQIGTVDIPTGARFADTRIVSSSDVRKGIFTLVSEASCVEDNQCVSKADLEKAAGEADLDALGVPEWARAAVSARGNDPRRLEGLITPGIHHLDPQLSAQEMIAKLVKESVKNYEDTGLVSSAESVGLSPYELITAASLIQMESPDGDFDKVARVILNRLDEDMQLQFDSTVNYDLPDQEIATTDEDRARVTPWNTYAKEGLPDTPIASPSIEAIKAMENPADGTWLYFVTVDKDGRTVFSTTFEEHDQAIAESRENGVLDSNR